MTNVPSYAPYAFRERIDQTVWNEFYDSIKQCDKFDYVPALRSGRRVAIAVYTCGLISCFIGYPFILLGFLNTILAATDSGSEGIPFTFVLVLVTGLVFGIPGTCVISWARRKLREAR